MRFRASFFIVALTCWMPAEVRGAERRLSLEDALSLARDRAPAVLAARARIEEARGRATTTAALLRTNPEVEAAVGRRRSAEEDFRDWELGLRQNFELGGRRGARVAGGKADVDRAVSESDDALRLTLREVALTFLRGLHAHERVQIASQAESLAADLVRTAELRYEQGDAAILDVNLARAALARAQAEMHGAAAIRAGALAELGTLLGVAPPDSLDLAGSLQRSGPTPELSTLVARARSRPDLRVREAELRAAEAEQRLGRGLAWPDLGLGARFERDAGDDVASATASLTLPLFDRGQGVRAEAGARVRRLRLELDAALQAADATVRAAYETRQERRAAVEALERGALPLLDENEVLSGRSYEAGQIGVPELLLVRRETLETRTEYLDRLLEAAIADIELEASAGVLE